MGVYANRRKFVTGFEDAPKLTIKIEQADTINGFVRKNLPHTQTKQIYDIYYNTFYDQ